MSTLRSAGPGRVAEAAGAAADDRATPGGPAPVDAQYLIFSLGGEDFGVATQQVQEIIPCSDITNVPLMPDCMRGVINLRGTVVPVIDLGLRIGRAATAVSRRTCIVIVQMPGSEDSALLGVLVDAVRAVRRIARASIEPTPLFSNRMRSDLIDGMARLNPGFVVLLNLDKVLSLSELSAMDAMDVLDAPREFQPPLTQQPASQVPEGD